MTAWSGLYDFLLPEVNGLTPALADFHLRRAAIEFCSETLVHVVTLPAIDVTAGTPTYDLTSDVDDTEVIFVKKAWFEGTPLDEGTLDVLNNFSTYWADHTSQSPRGYTQFKTGSIRLYPTPEEDSTGGLIVQVALTPTSNADGLDDWVAGQYADEIACGTKGKLMAMANRPWTDLDRSNYYLSKFEYAKSAARADANRSFTQAALSVAPRPWVR